MSFSVLRTCPSCGAKNRVGAQHLSDTGSCGACHFKLSPASEPIDVDAPAFDEIINSAHVPILVDFWAAWCGPCRAAAPELKALAAEMAGSALVLKVDTERNSDLAARFRVQSIPNFLVFRNGEAVFQQPGLAPRTEMRRWLQPV